jgi:hypothetical protein
MAPARKGMASAELLRLLKDAVNNKPEVVPDGWKKASELEQEWGLSPAHTQRLIRTGVQKGILETRRFRISTAARGAFPTPHYRKKN